jgi:hypothetical protein
MTGNIQAWPTPEMFVAATGGGPPPGSDIMITEPGDTMITETSSTMITE